MAHPFPFFGMWVKEFLGDNRVDAMTAEELGAYFRLLLMSWQEDPAATLPPDEGLLARWARLDTARWSACRERVLACFKQGRDGRLVQKRLREEYDRLVDMAAKRSQAGKKGAERRWQTHGKATDLPMANGWHRAYESKSDSESRENDGGAGEEKTPSSGWLARKWCMQLTRRDNWKRPADSEAKAEASFAELIRLGITADAIDAELDSERDRDEQIWQFRERLKRNHGIGIANGRVTKQTHAGLKEFIARGNKPNGSH